MGKRLLHQRRGKRSIHMAPSHRHKGNVSYHPVDNATATVEDIIHDPGHSSPIAILNFPDGSKVNAIATEGLRVDQPIEMGDGAQVALGNILPLSNIPEGTPIFNIECKPGDGGKLVRAGGTNAVVVSQGTKTVIQLPSGQFKSLLPTCRATIGMVAGGGQGEKPFVRAGKKRNALRSKSVQYPRVSGVAMNPVDHPHGGGGHQHVGKPSTVSRHVPPGRKVGNIAPKKKKKKKKKRL